MYFELHKKHHGNVEYYTNEESIGLCASVNMGILKIMEKKAECVLIINPGGTFSNNVLEVYRKYIGNNNREDVANIAPIFNLPK